jgi:hypothetical protein
MDARQQSAPARADAVPAAPATGKSPLPWIVAAVVVLAAAAAAAHYYFGVF